MYSEMLRGKAIDFVNKVSASTIVYRDGFMLSTIFRNLISNAIKYTQPAGVITVGKLDKNTENEITTCVA